MRIATIALAAGLTVAATMTGGVPAALAQDGAPPAAAQRPRVGPAGMLLQSVCVPWTAGIDAKRLEEAARARGFEPQMGGGSMWAIKPPQPLVDQGFSIVALSPERKGCTMSIAWVGASRLDALTADVENWLKTAPGGPFARRADGWKQGVAGKAERARAWQSATHDVEVVEMPSAMLSEMNDGALAVEVSVYWRKRG